jgi:hypothetical protein
VRFARRVVGIRIVRFSRRVVGISIARLGVREARRVRCVVGMCIVRSRRVRHSHRTHLKCLAVFVRVVVVRVAPVLPSAQCPSAR